MSAHPSSGTFMIDRLPFVSSSWPAAQLLGLDALVEHHMAGDAAALGLQ